MADLIAPDQPEEALRLRQQAAAALEKGQRELFMERSAQLLSILRAAGGLSDIEQHRPDQFDLDAVPL